MAEPSDLHIPFECYDEQHAAVLGITGSGKTVTSKAMVEQLVHRGRRVCIIDPIKSDWWGVTSNSAGDGPGLPFTIIGGPRGAVPLARHSGAALGKLVGSGELPLSIMDLSKLHDPKAAHEWFISFAEALWEHLSSPVHLVLEEAHVWAPKDRSMGAETMSTYWVKKLATGSRSRGVRLFACTQRTQRLHNDLLSSCRLVVGHQTIFPGDRKPIVDWIRGLTPDAAKANEVDQTLPTLKEGEAWVACAKPIFVRRMRLPMCETFDNSKTPASGAKARSIKTSTVDVDALNRLLGEAVEEAKANDPKLLRAEVDRLKRELADQRAKPSTTHAGELGKAQEQIAKLKDRIAQLEYSNRDHEAWRRAAEAALKSISDVASSKYAGLVLGSPHQHTPVPLPASVPGGESYAEPPVPAENGSLASVRAGSAGPTREGSGRGPRSNPAGGGNRAAPASGKRTPHERILDSIAWWSSIGVSRPSRVQVAVVAGYTASGGTFMRYVSALSSEGKIAYPDTGTLELTDAGWRCSATPTIPTTLAALHEATRALLDAPLRKILDVVLAARGEPVGRTEVAEQSGYEVTGGTFMRYVSSLSSLGLVVYPRKTTLAAAPILFPEGLR